jgi:RyR domain
MTLEQIARVCHNVNKAACEAFGDYSQSLWEDAPDWQKESAIKGVEFTLANPDAPPSASHDSWLAEKVENGWKYGPVKNVERKEHPCFVPYNELPPNQKLKDYLFQAVVRSLNNQG